MDCRCRRGGKMENFWSAIGMIAAISIVVLLIWWGLITLFSWLKDR